MQTSILNLSFSPSAEAGHREVSCLIASGSAFMCSVIEASFVLWNHRACWVQVVICAGYKILCWMAVCLWEKAHMGRTYHFNLLTYFWAIRIGTPGSWDIMGRIYYAYLSHLRGCTRYTPKNETGGNCILFLLLGWRTICRKSLQLWRLDGDL